MKSKQKKENPKEFDKISIMAQAYTELVDRISKLEKLDENKLYTINDIKMELTLAFKDATVKYMDEIMKNFENSMKRK